MLLLLGFFKSLIHDQASFPITSYFLEELQKKRVERKRTASNCQYRSDQDYLLHWPVSVALQVVELQIPLQLCKEKQKQCKILQVN